VGCGSVGLAARWVAGIWVLVYTASFSDKWRWGTFRQLSSMSVIVTTATLLCRHCVLDSLFVYYLWVAVHREVFTDDDAGWRRNAYVRPKNGVKCGTRWCNWLRHCTTSPKVAGSIEIFHWHNPSALGSTQPLTEMSTRNISRGVKAGLCIGLTTLPPSCADCLEIWEPQPPGILRASPGL
jgi:hypothetical protein